MIASSESHYDMHNQNEQLQALIASLDDIVFELSAEKRFLNVWTKDESLLFIPREQFIGKTITEVMGPLADQMNELADTIITTGQSREIKYSHINPDIEQHYQAKGNIINPNAPREELRLVLTVRDITNSVLQERHLTNTQRELADMRSMLEYSHKLSKAGAWSFRIDTGKIVWTDNTYAIYNIPKGTTITYEMILNFYTEEYREMHDRLVRAAIEDGTRYEAVLKTQTGKWIHVIGEAIREHGLIVALSGAVMDVTRQIIVEQELINAKVAAENAAHAKTNFLSVMSHEIRTPLNGIIGIANLLGINKAPEQEELIDSLIFSANHLLGLVNDILDLNKIQGDKLALIHDNVSLKILTNGTASQFKSMAKEKGLTLKVDIDANVQEHVMADSVRLGQILNNLVNNAIKFTDEGSVTVSLSQVAADAKQCTVRFCISDTGPGISEQDRKRIFEPFEQVAQSTNRKHAGTGLGLQIAQKLVDLMGGELELTSEPGKGSEFFFTLDFEIAGDKDTDNTTAATIAIDKAAFSQLNLLLAEDNPVNVLVAKKQLEGLGITPVCAKNGKEALKLMQQKHFDIALVDLHMPEMDGFELSAQIRKNYPDTFIVIFTADITKEAKERINNLNVYDIINKPFVPKEMYNILLKVWAEKQAEG